ncbi:MAG: DNA mismatch repair endonuclease MutL [Clostridium sp.]|nr:DNA mismatch repair endonuclease MutL [Clostridium sp.]
MAQIAVLDSETIDKIAAGEVVERPVSVVKELVENAMDAGANAVTVEITEGGTSFIRVTDNGSGIPKDQIRTAFLRHATSKIHSVEDLLSISSLGFRGEALSSIAAVSRVEIISKTADDYAGVRYLIAGGAEEELSEIGAPDGTTIMVRNLFYNIPVRRKFLKSFATEGSYIADLMEHLAMSRPEISFKFVMNRDTRFHTSGNGDLREVIYRIYGRDISECLLPVSYERDGIRIEGYIGKPEMNRANRGLENYFVNRRYIKSDIVARAVEEAYQSYLMKHKYPVCMLSITVPADEIDVNVHPSKMEIRFIRQQEFFDILYQAVLEALKGKELIPKVILDEKAHLQDIVAEQKALRKEAPEPFETSRLSVPVVREETIYGESEQNLQDFFQTNRQTRVITVENGGEYAKNDNISANLIQSEEQKIIEKPQQIELFDDKMLSESARAGHKILGQVFDTYWLVQYEDKLFIIDQHAAHEKVKFERLMKHLKEKDTPRQMLEPPVILHLNAKNYQVLMEYRGHFLDLGFEIEEFGGNEAAVRTVPMDLYGCNGQELLLNMLDELAEGPVRGTPDVIYEKLASMACKSAVKGNTALTVAEADELIGELLQLENPYHCPHGRPTIISMSKYELEKKFKRIV